MEQRPHFGSLLREAREGRRLSLEEIAHRTKISPSQLALIESGNVDDLPGEVFVRGFIRSYARSVGIPDVEPLGLFAQMRAARKQAAETLGATPVGVTPAEADGRGGRESEDGSEDGEQDGLVPRRGIGLAVFVIIVLLIATITLSLFLRQPPESGERLSLDRADRATQVEGSSPTC